MCSKTNPKQRLRIIPVSKQDRPILVDCVLTIKCYTIEKMAEILFVKATIGLVKCILKIYVPDQTE